MCTSRVRLALVVIALGLFGDTALAQFAMFPKTGELVSPDRRFLVRNIDPQSPTSDFVGTFHSLWLKELATGRSRKLCDYMGIAAVAWSDSDSLVVTQYLGKRTSRAMVFSADRPDDFITLDQPVLTSLVPVDLRPALRENDHVFIEASKLEHNTLQLTVWGYGQHDPSGFHWRCAYVLREGTATCAKASTP